MDEVRARNACPTPDCKGRLQAGAAAVRAPDDPRFPQGRRGLGTIWQCQSCGYEEWRPLSMQPDSRLDKTAGIP